MRWAILAVLIGLSFLSWAPAARADDKDDRIRALEEQLTALAAEVQALKEDRMAEKAAQIAVAVEPSAGGAAAADVQPEEQVKITMAPSPKFVYGEFSFQPFGRVHLDYAAFNDDAADHPDGAEFRRARLGVKGTVAEDFGYKVEIDFANEGVSFKDVYMNYTGIENAEIRVGSFKPPFSLEELTSANYITFIERSAATSAFVTGEIIGLGGFYKGDDWSFAAGAFNDDAGRSSTDDEAWSVAGRGTFAPVNDDRKTVHLGASAAYRNPDQANDMFDFDATAENAVQSADSVSAAFGDADNASLYGVEAAFVLGPVSVQGEYDSATVQRSGGNADVEFDGGYAQASWILTGERRPYDAGAGTFGRVVPDSPFDPAAGGWGAWEVAGRYSTLDVTDGAVRGGVMENYTAGLNWYLNKHVRLMGNYIIVDTDNDAVTPDDDPQIILFRGQVDF